MFISPNKTFYLLCLFLCLIAFPAKANVSVIEGFFHHYRYDMPYWSELEKYMESSWLRKMLYPKKKVQAYCSTLANRAEQEYAIWFHNDKFNEIIEPEQGAAIEKMHNELVKVYDYFGSKNKQADLKSCDAANEIVWPYYKKWAKKNWEKKKNYLDENKIWAQEQIKRLPQIAPDDPNDEYRTFIIEDVVFHVPREAFWLGGSHRDYKIEDGANLIFYGPNAEVGIDENSMDNQRNIATTALIRVSNGSWKRPCYGFEERDVCFGGAHTMFVQEILWCRSGSPPSEWLPPLYDFVESYAARWRRTCKPRVEFVWNDDMQMKGTRAVGVEGKFFEGPPEFPTRWLDCEHSYNDDIQEERGICKGGLSLYNADTGLYSRLPYMRYYVPIQLAKANKSIHDSIAEKIQSYILYSRSSQQKQKTLQK